MRFVLMLAHLASLPQMSALTKASAMDVWDFLGAITFKDDSNSGEPKVASTGTCC